LKCFTQDLHYFTIDLLIETSIHNIFDRNKSLNKSNMKKSILIFCTVLSTFSLTAFAYINWSDTGTNQKEVTDLDLVYNVGSRFGTTITKEELRKATSVLDIVPKEAEGWRKVSFQAVRVAILQDGGEIHEMGDDKELNAAQIRLLQSTDYSTNFYINARSQTVFPYTGKTEDYAYYFTIVPEKEAEYTSGHDALIAYLKENSKEKTAIIKQDKLQPGKVSFTITKEGTVANVKLSSTSGYPSVDEELIKIITNMPGKWEPAENSKGENVDQELVFFFGTQGC
jgi:Gram-negative bacterial TonB protein C-terminal